MRPAEVIRRGAAYLERHGIESPDANAERLMRSVLGADRTAVLARTDGLSAAEARAYGKALCLRCTGTPLQHLTREQGFRRLVLEVRPGVFVPRPETEVVVGVALERIASVRTPAVVDVGTGSGAIALAVKDERPDARVWSTDLSPDAVELARANATRLGLDVDVRVGDLFGALPAELRAALDLVVANPPYVPTERADELAPDTLADPPTALFGDLAFAERLLDAALVWLRPGGVVVQEIEEDTGSAITELARRLGFVEPSVLPDLNGKDRVLSAVKPDGR